uniref:NADH dehydrogenase subunit 4L n=1 Tax=Meghimatium bilineatum TaxID=318265 RepID=A0A218KBN7_9EUPU|nr:NADH dehydrogenase subunit 4L [Meghimatium bilineatum]AKK32354.1 NADH dehydrogenase subunit 4L [Meghimatium bilineatum]
MRLFIDFPIFLMFFVLFLLFVNTFKILNTLILIEVLGFIALSFTTMWMVLCGLEMYFLLLILSILASEAALGLSLYSTLIKSHSKLCTQSNMMIM